MQQAMSGLCYRFGPFRLDLGDWRLEVKGSEVEVQQKVLDLLATFVREPGELWTREALHQELWPGVRVSEDALFQVIRKARKALADDSRKPRWILTVPGRGYRFVGEVTEEGAEERSVPQASAPELPPGPRLPVERDVFVGRTDDMARVRAALEDGGRLVTLVGPGGTGKTRLAVHLGWKLEATTAGGVVFCDLSDTRTEDGVVHAVGRALNVPLDADPRSQLGHVLAARGRSVVILDNAEQVLEAVSEVVERWLERAPQTAFVVTSRVVLGVPGERIVTLAPLVPDDAVALFAARAAAVRGDFALTDEHRPVVLRLVDLLDRLPLALELAAARVRVWSPQQLLDRMEDRFRVLTRGGRRTGRQATLRATFDWGWALLEAWEREALVQLSVFEGGFDLEAVEAVLELPRDAPWAMDVVQDLVDKSWVQVAGEDRLSLLLSVQEYVTEQASADVITTAEARHGEHFAGWSHRRTEVQRLQRNIDNLVVACRRAIHAGRWDHAAGAGAAAWSVFSKRGPSALGVALAEELLAAIPADHPARQRALHLCSLALYTVSELERARGLTEAALANPGPLRGQLLAQLGRIHTQQGSLETAEPLLQEALAWSQSEGSPEDVAACHTNLGVLHGRAKQETEARHHFEAALTIQRTLGNRASEGSILANLGLVAAEASAFDEARRHYEAARQLCQDVGNQRDEAIVTANLALLESQLGHLEAARAAHQQALRLARGVGERLAEANALTNLGMLLVRHGELDEGEACMRQSLAIHEELENAYATIMARGALGQVHDQRGHRREAREAYRAAVDDLERLGASRDAAYFLTTWGRLERRTGEPGIARELLERATTLARAFDHANLTAFAWSSLGDLALDEGDREAAERCMREAEANHPTAGTEGGQALATLRDRLL